MLGGTDCTEVDIPEDVVVSDCHLRKPTEWRGWTGAKNLFEVKNAKKVTLERSLLEYSWVEGQIGFAILLNVRNQEGTAPWSTVEDVVIRQNRIRHVAGGLNLLGRDYSNPSQVMRRVTIEDNVIEGIDPAWGNNQRCLQFAHGGEDFTLLRNTFSGVSISCFMTFEGAPVTRLTVEGNTFPEGNYGIRADDTALGVQTLEKYAPGCNWSANTIVRTTTSNIPYPAGTAIVA